MIQVEENSVYHSTGQPTNPSRTQPRIEEQMKAQQHIEEFKAARKASVPIVVINTPDPEATIRACCRADSATCTDDEIYGDDMLPRISWNIASGVIGLNKQGQAFANSVQPSDANPALFLAQIKDQLPDVYQVKTAKRGGLAFIHNGHKIIADLVCMQSIWNLRDKFKGGAQMVVLLATGFVAPPEMKNDIVVIDEELPDEQEIESIVREIYKGCKQTPEEADVVKAKDTLRGLSAFAAEQVTAMAYNKGGLNHDILWRRKKQLVEQSPALKILDDPEASYESIGGCAVIKNFMQRVVSGKGAPKAIVFIDEIEKALAGQGDTSGVSQDQLGCLLTYMQDKKSTGVIFIGPPGAAKSAVAKATGNAAGIPTIQLDLGAAKGGIVGQSESQIRDALKVISAVSNDRSLWIATCNSFGELPPELLRRFTLGTYFFDLPTAEERAVIWEIYREKFGINTAVPQNETDWTGAEIRQACEIAWRIDATLEESSQYIVPVAKTAADKIEALRKQADGRFLSASYPGPYMRLSQSSVPAKRRMPND